MMPESDNRYVMRLRNLIGFGDDMPLPSLAGGEEVGVWDIERKCFVRRNDIGEWIPETVDDRIDGTDVLAHLLRREEIAMDRSERIWTGFVASLCGTLFGAAGIVYGIWGLA